MYNKKRTSSGLVFFTAILAFVVVILGAYTRLTDAGLGCPDWPGCYNHMIVPDNAKAISQAEQAYPNTPIDSTKAWTEMIHRYVAGSLGIFILFLAGLAIRKRHAKGQPLVVPMLLVAIVIFQAMLGMWTVTLKLSPPVVMGHLLGGMTILALLWWLFLKLRDQYYDSEALASFRPWALIGLIIVVLQIALGGWTSTNYAALVCPNFPYCQGHMFFPMHDFHDAFNIMGFLSGHLKLSQLGQAALITIQMTHRIGALITAFYVGLLAICLMLSPKAKSLKILGSIMLVVLALQITLGVLNVELLLPLKVAVAHNAIAALLLLTLVTLNYLVFTKPAKLYE